MEGAHSGARISADAQFPHFCRCAFRSAHLCLSACISHVLHLLERVDFPELLIQLATLAISETVDGLKSQAALRTRILQASPGFRTQPPVVQRCRAYSRSQQVVSIIEARAQDVDLLTHNYYEILYAFHIHRHNYPKALEEINSRLNREPKDENRQSQSLSSACTWTP
ncbi:nuclear pore complex protein Nup160-like isoform X2 [Ranitomeya variabilis]|uniref:nuclear pore complex protein Nup160-like isoform X2 n=1 Tax=Ranitomeya variabilis TaxID=490064 RepID=UPI0040579880